MPVRVVLADDHPLTRAGISAYLAQESSVELVGEAEDGIEAWRLIQDLRPDVALLDIRMPGEDGVAVARVKESSIPVSVDAYVLRCAAVRSASPVQVREDLS